MATFPDFLHPTSKKTLSIDNNKNRNGHNWSLSTLKKLFQYICIDTKKQRISSFQKKWAVDKPHDATLKSTIRQCAVRGRAFSLSVFDGGESTKGTFGKTATLASKTPIYTHYSVTAKATYGSRRQSLIASVPLRTTTKPHMARFMNSPSVQIATWKWCR